MEKSARGAEHLIQLVRLMHVVLQLQNEKVSQSVDYLPVSCDTTGKQVVTAVSAIYLAREDSGDGSGSGSGSEAIDGENENVDDGDKLLHRSFNVKRGGKINIICPGP
jgi:hypothetical protein